MIGACGCVMGPPHDGSPCHACGQRRLPIERLQELIPPRYPPALTESDIRRIVREELAALQSHQSTGEKS